MKRLIKLEMDKIKYPLFITIILSSIVLSILACTLYHAWSTTYKIDAWEIGTELFDFIFPVVVVLPLSWSLYAERKNNYISYISARVSLRKYLLAKWITQAISAFLILFIPNIVSATSALILTTPTNPSATHIAHIFQAVYEKAPLLYAVVLSIWRGFIGILIMSMGYVLSMYVDNIFIIMTGPFVYYILENFVLAVMGMPAYRLTTAYRPISVSSYAIRPSSFIIGPVLLIVFTIGIGLIELLVKKNRVRR